MHRETAENRANISDVMDAAYVSNVLLIGTDSRDLSQERGRSDSMILASINKKTRELTLTSFLRDSYVYIDDEYGYGKLNAAYSYGGAGLLMDTIESNYGVRIDDYILISFAACANVIDAVGGVKLDLTDEEADAVNEILISEVNELMGDDRNDDLLDCGGEQKLDGKQALSYSRIRYVGNADFDDTGSEKGSGQSGCHGENFCDSIAGTIHKFICWKILWLYVACTVFVDRLSVENAADSSR